MEFLLGVGSALASNVLTALLLYWFIERRAKRREEIATLRERAKEEKRRTRDARNILNASLLQQLPPLMQRIVETQRDAFSHGVLVTSAKDGTTIALAEKANLLRHIANVHLDVVEIVKSLGEETGHLKKHANLSNALGVAGLQLIRDGAFDENTISYTLRVFGQIETEEDSEKNSNSHIIRMRVLLGILEAKYTDFPCEEIQTKVDILGVLCEVVGHNSRQIQQDLIVVFEENSLRIIQTIKTESCIV